ncbi:coiled-coil domain-containing protein [Falsiroseomonas selenitidurans]|uniref:Bacteriophage tail tape measure N-terminal domain-containing protein n=1 Tax=Falsiroseomonas selenitidurans TaxID=2716335 RepID=A0ABX1E9F0_9PROT|nr:hypothetical protein [Falsiroseomonas selenitidurans]NKC33501.1 hypothetical protein [Falsiroseomonas selenitidurans]
MSGSAGGARFYSFRISAEGMQEFVRDLGGLAQQTEQADRAINRLIQASPQLASALTSAQDATDRAAKRAAELRAEQERALAASQAQTRGVAGLTTALGGMEGNAQRAATRVGELRGALELLGASGVAGALAPVASAAGNLADLFSTASLAAGRFEGVLNLLNARVLGMAALAGLPLVLQSVGVGITQAGDAALSADDAMTQWNATLLRLNPTLEQTTRQANAAAEAIRKTQLAELELSFGRTIETRGSLISRLPELDARLLQAERAAADAEARATSLTLQAASESSNPLLRNRALLGASSLPEANRATQRAAEARDAVNQLREQRIRLEDEIRRLGEAENEFRNTRSVLQGPIYGESAGPPDPPGLGGSSGGGSAARDAERAAREAERDQREYERAEDLARRTAQTAIDAEARAQAQIARAQERADEQRARQAERTTDRITGYLADGLADAAQEGGFRLDAMLRGFQQTLATAPFRIVVEAAIRPAVSGAVSYLGLAGDQQTGGTLSQLLGYTSAANQVAGALGLTDMGGFAGLANTPLWGGNVAGPVYNGFAASGAPTLGAVAGGIGGGYALGSIIGGFTAGDSAARQQNAQIGSAGGAAGGAALGTFVFPGVGTALGGLIGGALGGGGGGLIGPGPKTNAFGFNLEASGGRFGTDALRTTGNGNGGAEVLAQAQQAVAQANAALAAAQLTVQDNRRAITGVNSADQSASFADALGSFGFTSGNATIARALSARPDAGLEEALGISNFVTGLYAQISAAAEPLSEFAAAMASIQAATDPAIQRARELSLETDRLVAAQQRQVDQLVDQQRRAFRSATESTTVRYFRAIGRDQDADLLAQQLSGEADVASLRAELERIGTSAGDVLTQIARREEVLALERLDIQRRYAEASAAAEAQAAQARVNASRGLYEQLAFGDLGGLSPAARALAAQESLASARAALLQGATTERVAEYSRVATATLPVLRDYLGTSTAYAGVVGGVTGTLREFAPEGDYSGMAALIESQTRGTDRLEIALFSNRDAVADLAQRFDRLAAEVRAIAAKKG